jgi:hypothetical protein
MRIPFALLVAGSFAGCTTEAPAPPPPAQAQPPAAPAPATPVPAPAPVAKPATEKGPHAPSADFAQVEISGQLTMPVGEKGTAHVFVTDAECWKEGARAYGEKVAPGAFNIEVIVPQGSPLWVCAALVPEGKKPKPVWYGSATRGMIKGEGLGEVVYAGLDVPLRKGPPVSLPAPRPSSK